LASGATYVKDASPAPVAPAGTGGDGRGGNTGDDAALGQARESPVVSERSTPTGRWW
jgi:hypothetical protein